MKRKSPFAEDNTREETQPEYHSRVQNQITEDSWNGVDTVGQEFPKRGRVFEEGNTLSQAPLVWHDDSTNRRRGR